MHKPGIRTSRLVLLSLLLCLAPWVAAQSASAAVGDPSIVQCITGHDVAGCTTSRP